MCRAIKSIKDKGACLWTSSVLELVWHSLNLTVVLFLAAALLADKGTTTTICSLTERVIHSFGGKPMSSSTLWRSLLSGRVMAVPAKHFQSYFGGRIYYSGSAASQNSGDDWDADSTSIGHTVKASD